MEVFYVQYTTAASYTILNHSARILAETGWTVRFYGVRAANDADKIRATPHPRICVRELPATRVGWQQKLHYLAYLFWVLAAVIIRRPIAMYCSERNSCPVGLLARRFLGVPVIYHEHDPVKPATKPVEKWLEGCRRRLAAVALACVVPNEDRAEQFRRELRPSKLLVIWNGVSMREVQPTRPAKGDGQFVLWYQGMIVADQLPIAVVEALAKLPSAVRLRFVGVVLPSHRHHFDALQRRAVELGVAGRVEYLGVLPRRDDLYAEMATADVGLVLFRIPFGRPMAGASQKPFEYLAAGLTLLVPELPEWRSFSVEPGYGYACDPGDPNSIAAAIGQLLGDPTRTRAMGEAGRRRIVSEWNYEMQFEPAKSLLEGLAAKSGFSR